MLRFGLIGLGHFGKHYARLLQELPNVYLIAVANDTMEVFRTHKDLLHPDILQTTNPAEVLSSPQVDCVVIATPASTHFALVVAALRAGKHVLVEKPLTTNVAEANTIRILAREKRRVCLVGFQYVYNNFVRALARLLPELGTIKYCFGEHQSPGPIRSDAGSFIDAGVHDLSLIYFLFNPGMARKVSGSSFGVNEDFSSVAIKFSSGLRAHIFTTWYAPEKTKKFTVVGELGIAEINDRQENDKLRVWRCRYPAFTATTFPSSIYFNLPEPEIPTVTANEPLRNELEHFINCVHTNTQPTTNADFGYQLTLASLSIYKQIQRM